MDAQLFECPGTTVGVAMRQMQRDGPFERLLGRVGQSQIGTGPTKFGSGPCLAVGIFGRGAQR